MGKKEICFTLFFMLCIFSIFVFGGTKRLPEKDLSGTSDANVYTLGTELSDHAPDIVGTYLPIRGQIDDDTAKSYAALFDMKEELENTENYFSFSASGARLYVDKTMNRLKYKTVEPSDAVAEDTPENADEIIQASAFSKNIASKSESQLLRTAAEFIKQKNLPLEYETAMLSTKDDSYEITFLGDLAGYKNFALANKIVLDNNGSVVNMDYYYPSYEKFHSVRIKSEQQAFYELPETESGKIFIKVCQLVYIYKNSIVQPAYLFEGYKSDGEYFHAFVPVSVYS